MYVGSGVCHLEGGVGEAGLRDEAPVRGEASGREFEVSVSRALRRGCRA